MNIRSLYHQSHDVTREEVIRVFLSAELNKKRQADDVAETARRALVRSCLVAPAEELEARFRAYMESVRDEGNPTVVWTIGRGNDRRFQNVRRWVRAEGVPLTAFYSNGVNDAVNAKLLPLGGSIAQFAKFADQFPEEFSRINDIPPIEGDERALIGVVSARDALGGRVELIDGFHRAVSMVRGDIEAVPAYLAIAFG